MAAGDGGYGCGRCDSVFAWQWDHQQHLLVDWSDGAWGAECADPADMGLELGPDGIWQHPRSLPNRFRYAPGALRDQRQTTVVTTRPVVPDPAWTESETFRFCRPECIAEYLADLGVPGRGPWAVPAPRIRPRPRGVERSGLYRRVDAVP